MKHQIAFSVLLVVAGACGDDGGGASTDAAPPIDGAITDSPDGGTASCSPQLGVTLGDLRLEEVTSGLTQPVLVTAPAGDGRLFVVEQPGRIRIIENGEVQSTPFLDVRDRVKDNGYEQGLLGLAFHPDWASNGKFYLNYTRDAGDYDETRISELTVPSVTSASADPATERVLLDVPQDFSNHNGGMIAFGSDGFLYIGMGDGGDGGDTNERGVDPNTLLGSMLRIDVDGSNAGSYGIPADNPFVGGGGAPEVYAYGLRNPWRFSFDSMTGDIYIADVGQNRIEEVSVASPAQLEGAHFGWDVYEGSECFNDTGNSSDWDTPGNGCTLMGTIEPATEYYHPGSTNVPGGAPIVGNSISGGNVYRGSCLPEIQGVYFYGDFGSGAIRTFEWSGTAATNEQDITDSLTTGVSLNNPSAFGEDGFGELYVVDYGGRVYRIVAP